AGSAARVRAIAARRRRESDAPRAGTQPAGRVESGRAACAVRRVRRPPPRLRRGGLRQARGLPTPARTARKGKTVLPNLKILGIVGSLRRESHNLKLMRVAQRRMPGGAQLDIFTLEGIPPFNQDEEQQPPPKVIELKNAIRAADAILIATPEYNYSIPGVLKNAIDWSTRPYGHVPLLGKPAAIMGATIGGMGT